ncbi:MAG: ATP-binding protein [Acetivibrionales bacterium]|nr:ATP-binding protein [Clostridiaceae bacterium]HOA55514.1 ATP-binding protein [Clostridiales bacterium]
MKSRCIYSTDIPSELSKVRLVVEELISRLQQNCGELCDEVLFDFKVILNEILINAILHGNHGDKSKKVKIDAGVTEKGEVFLIIEDEGSGYDFDEICQKNESSVPNPDDMIESGRGIMIVKGLCDKVKVNKKGNKITILKRIEKTHKVIKHI